MCTSKSLAAAVVVVAVRKLQSWLLHLAAAVVVVARKRNSLSRQPISLQLSRSRLVQVGLVELEQLRLVTEPMALPAHRARLVLI